ncbi:MAG: aminotransferase class I/II-fold pyridoxal phosphate-dependent enzyme [Caldilineae bacterium]|nr:MAG: aminotransferase class I/II-fold pyridoxal phosphate-dependent enzyme [Caldilineae bacterium]
MLNGDSPIAWRIAQWNERVASAKAQDLYLYLQEAQKVEGMHVTINGRKMLQFASYSYLDLLGHPKIDAAAKAAIDEFGSGTHGVRLLAGTIRLHTELERTIAEFKGTEDAMVFSSGFVCNSATIAALVGRNDVVISDKLNHASIVDGCLLSRAKFIRVAHNDMDSLEKALASVPEGKGKLVVADAVFSMDGDILNLPVVAELCQKYNALLMVDEAHSVGVIGKTGRGIEEHFGLKDVIDVKMGTLSKTIPSVGGYIAGSKALITYLKHTARAFIFSAALPPASVAAAKASFEVMMEEQERIQRLQRNVDYFIKGLQERGFNTLNSETPIVPIIAGDDERAWLMAKLSQDRDVFVLPVVSPAVPANLARLRANVTAGHTLEEIEYAMDVFEWAAKQVGVL